VDSQMIQRFVLAVLGALAGVATLVAVAFAWSPSVAADPSNGTGPCVGVDGDHLPWFDPCANPPPVPGENNWAPDDEPGMWGPSGWAGDRAAN
jgi:hypothetical protein